MVENVSKYKKKCNFKLLFFFFLDNIALLHHFRNLSPGYISFYISAV